MNQPNTDKIPRKFRILIAPLDWGLGHATRCIPIIRSFLQKDVDMWLAGEGAQAQLLHTEFPSLPILDLPGYQIKYAKTKRGLLWKIFMQLHSAACFGVSFPAKRGTCEQKQRLLTAGQELLNAKSRLTNQYRFQPSGSAAGFAATGEKKT